MDTTKKNFLLQSEISNNFKKSIETWSIIMHERFECSYSDAQRHAISEIYNMKNDDFFEELSPCIIDKITQDIEYNPEKTRKVIEEIFKNIARKDYDYAFEYYL